MGFSNLAHTMAIGNPPCLLLIFAEALKPPTPVIVENPRRDHAGDSPEILGQDCLELRV